MGEVRQTTKLEQNPSVGLTKKERPVFGGLSHNKRKLCLLDGHGQLERPFSFFIQTLDRRYVTSYRTSLVANLRTIKAKGVREFLAEEERRWRCPSCGGTVSIHTGQCCDCHSG